MTKRTRRILLSILLVVFFILVSFFIFYSQGYRFDFEQKKIVKTGGIYVKTIQSGIEVYLDDKLKEKINPIFKSTLIRSILPKTHGLQLKKEGFYDWDKNLEVQEGIVTEIRNAYLFPQDPKKEKVLAAKTSIEDFYFSPNQKKALLVKKDAGIEILDINSGEITPIQKKIYTLKNLKWSHNSKMILIEHGSRDAPQWLLINLENNQEFSLSLLGDIKEVFWPKQSAEYFYFLKKVAQKNTLFKYEIGKTPESLLIGINSFGLGSNNLFWIDNGGFLLKGSLDGKSAEKLMENKITDFKTTDTYQLIELSSSKLALIKNQNTFYLIQNKKLEKIADGIKEIKISRDAKKILYFGNRELWVMWLEEYLVQPFRKEGEKEMVMRLSQKISDVQFFERTGEHLIYRVANQIKIAELDSRDKRNVVDLINASGKFYYNNSDKNLYFLDQNQFYRIEL